MVPETSVMSIQLTADNPDDVIDLLLFIRGYSFKNFVILERSEE
jgi:hypothetical protein